LVVVVAAVIERADQILVTERRPGSHLGGHWEFPGGKVEHGETHVECLQREMREELGVVTEVGPELLSTRFDYPGRTVELHFRQCVLREEPTPMLGQRMEWVPRAQLHARTFPPADRELIDLLVKSESKTGGR
jgi:mutator protein MutT